MDLVTNKTTEDISISGSILQRQNEYNAEDAKEYLITGKQIKELTVILAYITDMLSVPAIEELNSLPLLEDYVLTDIEEL